MQSIMAENKHTRDHQQPRSERAATTLPSNPSRVLVADDEHLIATGVASDLSDLGFEVVGPATNGKQAIDLCEQEQPDLALLDIEMPGCNGIEAARIVFKRFGIPVVIFSAYSDPGYVASGKEAGVFGYLLKPVTQDQLRVGVSVAWSRYCDAHEKDDIIDQLQRRLEERKAVEQAKWIIVKQKSISEPEAHKILQRQARNNRLPLIEVARAIIDSDTLPRE